MEKPKPIKRKPEVTMARWVRWCGDAFSLVSFFFVLCSVFSLREVPLSSVPFSMQFTPDRNHHHLLAPQSQPGVNRRIQIFLKLFSLGDTNIDIYIYIITNIAIIITVVVILYIITIKRLCL